jgi:hypothetical protein
MEVMAVLGVPHMSNGIERLKYVFSLSTSFFLWQSFNQCSSSANVKKHYMAFLLHTNQNFG